MSFKDKKYLQKFIDKAYNWACNFDEFGVEELKEIKDYLQSNLFYLEVSYIADRHERQGEINTEVTLLVSNKLLEIQHRIEYYTALQRILSINNIKTNQNKVL